MANDFYNATFKAAPITVIRSDDFNSNNDEIVTGFGLLPTEQQLKRIEFGTDASSSAALYEVTVPHLSGAYFDGFEVTFQAIFSNTGAANISVNGESIVALIDNTGSAIPESAIQANQSVTVIYILSQDKFQIISTSTSAADANSAKTSADASAASAADALISENNAATSETNAAASAATLDVPFSVVSTTGNTTITGSVAAEYIVTRIGTGNGTISIDTSTLDVADKITIHNILETSGIATITNLDGNIALPDGTTAASHTLTGKGTAFLQKIDGTNDLTVVSLTG